MTGTFPERIPAAAQLPRRALSTAAGDCHSEGLYCLVTPGALPLTALLMLLQASWEGVSVGHPQLSCLVPGQDQNPAPPEQPISISRASPGHHNGGKPSVDARCPPNFPTLRNLDQGGDREVGDKWLGAPGHCLSPCWLPQQLRRRCSAVGGRVPGTPRVRTAAARLSVGSSSPAAAWHSICSAAAI